MNRSRQWLLVGYAVLVVLSLVALTRLRFRFDFEQFFPVGDPEWAFYKAYVDDFESDDNFLLVALPRSEGVFDADFLARVHDFTQKAGHLPYITAANSITTLDYPLKTPFGITTVPVVHLDDTSRYVDDRKRLLGDPRFVHNFISADGKAVAVVMKTVNRNTQAQAEAVTNAVDSLLATCGFAEAHRLGRAYFQRDLVWMQQREILVSTIVAALLACAVVYFFFRRWRTVFLTANGIGLALLFFMAALSLLGRELNVMAGLYPVLMCIVGVADTMHLTTKYMDELHKGHSQREAMRITLREVGLATLITCITTAIGFGSLATNRTVPIQEFGLNAALGVVIAFVTIYGWLWAMLPRYTPDQLVKFTREYAFWDRFMAWVYTFTRRYPRPIAWGALALLVVCLVGIGRIHTNYKIENNLPRGQRVTHDFHYFERTFAGFRPVEIAVFPQNDRRADDFEVLKAMEGVEKQLRTYPAVRTVSSVNDLYRTVNAMQHGNQPATYVLPDSAAAFETVQRMVKRLPKAASAVLMTEKRDKARISARMQDVGRDSFAAVQTALESWWKTHTDSSIVRFRMTGTGVLYDKNALYIRDNMLQGLIPSVLVVALLMGLLYKDWRAVVIFCVPNIFPLFFAGALIGYAGVALESGIAIVFSIVFGIATDDTIHFLSTLRIHRNNGVATEEALRLTLMETGKAMCLSSLILFFSFLVMLFSIHPPSVMVGVLVSITLAGALFCDLFLAPILVRKLMR